MSRTVGKTDRGLRGLLAVGAVVGSGLLGFSSGWGIVLLAVAAVMAVTGASGYCPVYSLLRVDTLGGERPNAAHRGGFRIHRAA
jgi:hypothetical protein